FSRAAWGNYVIVMTFFILFVNSKYINKLKLIIILIAILVPFLNYLINNTEAGELFNRRTSLQTYDEDRFSEQQKAIDYLELYPLGFGPGQSEEFLKQSTHSLYIRVFTENGFIGGLIIILFLITTLLRSLVISRQAPEKYREFYKLVTICIIGIIFNSFFVDTLHWRHLWFLLAIPWMNIKNKG
ncbi:O-antigen ligase family protein, partial [Salinicoccus jeotgali]